VGSGQRRGRRLGQRGTTAGAFPSEPDVLGARLLLCGRVRMLASPLRFSLAARVLVSLGWGAIISLEGGFRLRFLVTLWEWGAEIEPVRNLPHVEID
jgi:hypothetical protein